MSESNGHDPNPWFLDGEGRLKIPPDPPSKRTYVESMAVKMARLSAPRHRTVVALLSLLVALSGVAAFFAWATYTEARDARLYYEIHRSK